MDISSDPFLDETAITQALAAAAYYYSQANIAACNYYHAASAFGTGLSQNFAYGGAHHAATKIDVVSKIMAATDDAGTKIMAAPKFKAAAKIDAATEAYRRDLLDGSVPDVKTFSKVIAPPKKFDKVIAPPKKIDKIIAPPKKLDQVIAPPKRVPKDITNLPKEVVSKKVDMPFMGEYRAPVVSYYF